MVALWSYRNVKYLSAEHVCTIPYFSFDPIPLSTLMVKYCYPGIIPTSHLSPIPLPGGTFTESDYDIHLVDGIFAL